MCISDYLSGNFTKYTVADDPEMTGVVNSV